MPDTSTHAPPARLVGADRVLAVLLELGSHPHGVTLDALASALASPKPTIHRALASLCRAGLARQVSRGIYILGDDLFQMVLRNISERPDALVVEPVLERLTAHFGETAHFAVLDGTEVVYRAKMDPPRGAVRLTSVIGGRNPAHCTAVGKLLLSQKVTSRNELVKLLGTGPLLRRTENTIIDVDDLWTELVATHERGYAIDDQENEPGVNCVAVSVGSDPHLPGTGAVSVSALTFRMPMAELIAQAPTIARIAHSR